MEFLIGRTLANNITNLQVEEFVRKRLRLGRRAGLAELVRRRSPTRAWATAAWAGWPPVSSTRWPRSQIPAVGYGLRYEYGMFRQEIKDGRQVEHPDNWLSRPDPWEVVRPSRDGRRSRSTAPSRLREGRLTVVPNVPTVLRGIPYDRPVVGYGGKTINTLRLWGAAAHEDFNFLEFSRGDFFDAVHEKVAAEVADARSLSRRFDTPRAATSASSRSISWSPARWPTSWRRFRRRGNDWQAFPTRWPSSSTTPIPQWPSPS